MYSKTHPLYSGISTINYWRILSISACLIMLLMHIGFIVNNLWGGDFWEHRAILKELIQHPFHPVNPILNVEAPHAFFSPYMVTLGVIGHFFGLESLHLLNLVSIFNLLFFIYSIYLLSKLFLTQENPYRNFFLLLVTHLFFWGIGAWGWSGFFHLGVLNFGLPYPSTFAFCLSILSAYLFNQFNRKEKSIGVKIVLIILVILFNWVILLTHPITYAFTGTLFLFVLLKTRILKEGLSNSISLSNLASIINSFIALFLPLVLTVFWSYYPFLSLFTSAAPDNQFHLDSKVLYSKPLVRIFPIGIILVLMYFEGRRFIFENAELLLLILILLVIYSYGFLSQEYGYGRVISYMVLYFHILLVPYLTSAWNKPNYKRPFYILLIALSLPYIAFNLLPIIHRSIPFMKQTESQGLELGFIEKHLTNREVVLADKTSSRFIPAFGGRVIASLNPPYWIADNKQRLQDMISFFQDSTLSNAERQLIIKKYSPDYILLSPQNQWIRGEIAPFMDLSGKTIESKGYILAKVKK